MTRNTDQLLPGSYSAAQDCGDTCVWAATLLKLGCSFLKCFCGCLFPRKHLTFQNLQEHLDRLLAEENGSEESRGRRHWAGVQFVLLLVLLNWEGKLYHKRQSSEWMLFCPAVPWFLILLNSAWELHQPALNQVCLLMEEEYFQLKMPRQALWGQMLGAFHW